MNKEKLKTLQTLTLFGSKFVVAYPMTRLEYNNLRNWDLPSDENGDDEGFMIENLTNAKPNTDFSEGYISWSTKEQVFLEFRETDNFPFGVAIEALKMGHKVQRSGWNGKDMYLVILDPARDNLITLSVSCIEAKRELALQPFIVMKTVDNTYVPWLASQTDMLSDDWRIVNFIQTEPEGKEENILTEEAAGDL